MPPSQLKRLKSSLREQGITGPQKSKKKRKNGNAPSTEQRIRRNAALQSIRETFNPFDVKAPTRPSKFDVTSNNTMNGQKGSAIYGRPGVTKSLGEEHRRKKLLPEIHRRNKVGGILDRRIGENDPTMTPDERMLERYTREKQKKKGNVFDLENDDMEDELTHMGQSLSFAADGVQQDDFVEDISVDSSEDEAAGGISRKRKLRSFDAGEYESAPSNDQPERKKTKNEVMKEVVAKSKLHKYERQQAKEDDEDLREELDKGLDDLMSALRGHPLQKTAPSLLKRAANDFSINPERARLLNGADRAAVEKDYDVKLRQMALDKRAKPTTKTKTLEEAAREDAERLKEQTEKRLQRMRGDQTSDSEDEPALDTIAGGAVDVEYEDRDDAAEFGLRAPTDRRPLDVEDEDDFVIDDDLIARPSDLRHEVPSDEDDDDEDDGEELSSGNERNQEEAEDDGLDETYDETTPPSYLCPKNLPDLLGLFSTVEAPQIPLVIQRIRALYSPQLQAGNKDMLAEFSAALVESLVHMGHHGSDYPLPVVETVIRHIHSLSRTFPEQIARSFRRQLQHLQTSGTPTPGHLVILTAIGTIYPTSDHFHQVVTPAITLITRWLGLTIPKTTQDFATGAYLGALCIKYQQLSKRYIPELIRFATFALKSPKCPPTTKAAHITNISSTLDLWSSNSAFTEIFSPSLLSSLQALAATKSPFQTESKTTLTKLTSLLSASRRARRLLQLHHHRPLAIKSALPKFEERFNPSRDYDPDRARHEANKLRAEYKREKKGAMRELRKDANFIAREQLRVRREGDERHKERERRVIAEINAEGGREEREYGRERERRIRAGKGRRR